MALQIVLHAAQHAMPICVRCLGCRLRPSLGADNLAEVLHGRQRQPGCEQHQHDRDLPRPLQGVSAGGMFAVPAELHRLAVGLLQSQAERAHVLLVICRRWCLLWPDKWHQLAGAHVLRSCATQPYAGNEHSAAEFRRKDHGVVFNTLNDLFARPQRVPV